MTIGRIPSVEGGIQPTIVTARGDLIVATGNATLTRQPVGSDGQVLVADSTQADGVAWQSVATPFAAGKNKIINGDFGIWQRGTSFSNPADGAYTADRFYNQSSGTGVTRSITQQTFTPGTAPVSGYEGQYFLRYAVTVAGTSPTNRLGQNIEDVRTFAGQTITVSAWMKADANRNVTFNLSQLFGSGGSAENYFGASSNLAVTTSWQRFTYTVAVPSVSGKTIGTSSSLKWFLEIGTGTFNLDIWGLQIEAGSTATPFTTATGTIQGELAACQRYYWRAGGDAAYQYLGVGFLAESTNLIGAVNNPVFMRAAPTSADFSTLLVYDGANTIVVNSVTLSNASKYMTRITLGLASNPTANRPYSLATNNSTSGYLGFSAEL